MKNLYFESTTTLTFDSPVVDHHFLLRLLPPTFPSQRIISATLQITPSVPYTLAVDAFGNLQETGCIKFPHKEFVYRVTGLAQINADNRSKAHLNPIYKHISHYTKPSKAMLDFLAKLHLEGSNLEKGLALSEAIFNYMAYTPGITCTATTAREAFDLKQGVCQDYAHIFIALARAAGIPSRYANGLPLGFGQSHAWTEIYTEEGIWRGIDPTHNRLTGEDYVRFCVGRDFLDCSLERGILFGNANQTQTTTTQVIER